MMGGAILVAYDNDEAVAEAKALCEAAGYAVEHVFCQKFMRRPKYGISEEALGALEEHAQRLGPDVIVYDEALKPSQNYNLASKLHRNVLDREALILEIFEGRASSAESKLQVKLAQMRYEMSRAREKVRLAKMGEQPGFMGIGKFEVDTYYNDIRHRMNSVKSKLVKARKQRQLHRDGRKRAGWATVSLVGYTSAGKTTLFNAVTGETKEQSGQLFTTLSTTTRRTDAGGAQVLVSDTVGFISKLPAYMIEAFRSTLEEILYADAVILVVDASDPQDRIRKKFRSCTNTLADLGVQLDRVVIALNKSDRVPRTDVLQIAQGLGLEEGARWAAVSAVTGSNCKRLMEMAGKITQAGSAGQSAWRGEQWQ